MQACLGVGRSAPCCRESAASAASVEAAQTASLFVCVCVEKEARYEMVSQQKISS